MLWIVGLAVFQVAWMIGVVGGLIWMTRERDVCTHDECFPGSATHAP